MKSILANADVFIVPGYGLNTDVLFTSLMEDVNWTLYSKNSKRLKAVMGKDYFFSGKLHKAEEIHPYIKKLMDRINRDFGFNLNSVYLNYYPDSSVGLTYHQDREEQLVLNSPVVSISLGDPRTFWFKCVSTKREKGWLLNEGDLCVMGNQSQFKYQHGLKAENIPTSKGRISITFRCFK